MKRWQDTGEYEILEQCPCCLGPTGHHGRMWSCDACSIIHALETRWLEYAERRQAFAAIGERDRKMAVGSVRETVTFPPEGADAKVWGVWMADESVATPGWCSSGMRNTDTGPWTREFADRRIGQLQDHHPEATYEVRRIDDPRCKTQNVAATPLAIKYAASACGKILPSDVGCTCPQCDLDWLPRVLFDADENLDAYLLAHGADGRREDLPRVRGIAWDRDELGKRTYWRGVAARVAEIRTKGAK